jgi:hypothetical protein
MSSTEGSQIIQLFGRGVRLKGWQWSLKRSSHARPLGAPQHIRLIETLNVFGVQADFMVKFRQFLEDEGLPAKTRKELLSRAESLALEACTAASALGDRDQTTEFAAKMLEVLEDAEDVEAVRLTQKLRDIYLEASGEEWVEEEEEEEEEEEGAGSAAKK